MDKDRKMRCKVCIKEIVFGYVDPNKDYTLCENCAFKDEEHSLYPYVCKAIGQYDRNKEKE